MIATARKASPSLVCTHLSLTRKEKLKTFVAKLLHWGLITQQSRITTTKPGAPITSKPGPPPFSSISKDEFDGCMLVKEAMTRPRGQFRTYLPKKKHCLKTRARCEVRPIDEPDRMMIDWRF